MSTPAVRTASDRNVSIIGGLKRSGAWTVARRILLVTLVGGVSLDLHEAILEGEETTVTKISLVGGVHLEVPDGVRVEVTGFSLFGGSKVDPDHLSFPTEHVVRVRNFGLFGGVSVA